MNGWWLTGLADGESSFIIQRYAKRATHAQTWRFAWVIALRKDDSAAIEKVQRMMGGRICEERSSHRNPMLRLQVFRHEDLRRVIGHFTRFPLQSKKARDFETWARAFRMWTSAPGGRGKRKPSWAHLKLFVLQTILHSGRRYR